MHINDDLKEWSGWNAGGTEETTKQLTSTLPVTELELSRARAESKKE